MNLGDLIAGLGAQPIADAHRCVRICDITDDSRTVVPGSLFIARSGTKEDGRKYIAGAVEAGAVAVLTEEESGDLAARPRVPVVRAKDLPVVAARIAERFYGDPSCHLTLIGITGTNGKTTTAHLVHQTMNGAGVRCGLIGTVVVDDGVSVGPASLTTPPATELSRTLGVMVEAGCAAAVMESSSHALDQGRVAALAYNVAVFTNLTGDHLDYHGTMENYASAKARLFSMLPEDGWAVVNADDPWAERMVQGCAARVLACSVLEEGSLWQKPPVAGLGRAPEACTARIVSTSMAGTKAEFRGPWGTLAVSMRLVGRHNVMNALQAVAACHAAGLAPPDLRSGIESAVAPPGRLEPVTVPGDPFAVLVDYAHTDDALRKVLAVLRPLVSSGGRLAVVFGCGGDRDRTKRPRMGLAAAELADVVFVTSDNPRTEKAGSIIDQVLAGVPDDVRHKVSVDADRRHAIWRAVEQAQAGDIVLVAGKGHETEQILPDGKGGTVRHHFDDREVAAQALAHRRRHDSGADEPAMIVVKANPGAAGARDLDIDGEEGDLFDADIR